MAAAVASRRRPPVRRVNMRNGSARRKTGRPASEVYHRIHQQERCSIPTARYCAVGVCRIDGRRAPGGDLAGGKRRNHQHTRHSGERGSIDRRDAKQQRRHHRVSESGRPAGPPSPPPRLAEFPEQTLRSPFYRRASRSPPNVAKASRRRSPGSVHHELLEIMRPSHCESTSRSWRTASARCRLSVKARRRLLRAQGVCRFDVERPPRGDDTCQEGNRAKQRWHRDERHWIGRLDVEQQAAHDAAHRNRACKSRHDPITTGIDS